VAWNAGNRQVHTRRRSASFGGEQGHRCPETLDADGSHCVLEGQSPFARAEPFGRSEGFATSTFGGQRQWKQR